MIFVFGSSHKVPPKSSEASSINRDKSNKIGYKSPEIEVTTQGDEETIQAYATREEMLSGVHQATNQNSRNDSIKEPDNLQFILPICIIFIVIIFIGILKYFHKQNRNRCHYVKN